MIEKRSFRRLVLISLAGLLVVAGAYAFGRYSERKALAGWLSRQPCWGMTVGLDDRLIAFPAYDTCVHMRGVRLRGEWINGFEQSEFIARDSRFGKAWFEVDEVTQSLLYQRLGIDPDADGELRAEIEFIGTRSTKAGSYGHLGGSRQMVSPRRILSVRLLSWKPN